VYVANMLSGILVRPPQCQTMSAINGAPLRNEAPKTSHSGFYSPLARRLFSAPEKGFLPRPVWCFHEPAVCGIHTAVNRPQLTRYITLPLTGGHFVTVSARSAALIFRLAIISSLPYLFFSLSLVLLWQKRRQQRGAVKSPSLPAPPAKRKRQHPAARRPPDGLGEAVTAAITSPSVWI
jgi:hypothetical protein